MALSFPKTNSPPKSPTNQLAINSTMNSNSPPVSPESLGSMNPFNKPLMPDHSNDNFLAAFSNLETHEVEDSEDEDNPQKPWWDGVYGTGEGDVFDMEEELLDACEDGDLTAVMDLIGNDIQKSNVNLDCDVPLGAPDAPQYSRSKRTVIYRPRAFQIACANGRLDIVEFLIEREEVRERRKRRIEDAWKQIST